INLFPEDPFDAAQAKGGDDDDLEGETVTIDLASSHMGCAKMLRELDLSDDIDDGNGSGRKGVDTRRAGGGVNGTAGAKGGDG
ncbi:unnamed protein product, partial [Ectocarpus sp. 12 AP-2014]